MLEARVTPEADSKEKKEARMVAAINQLAEKHGCSVQFDFDKHTIEFDCPNKESELDLAMEVKKYLKMQQPVRPRLSIDSPLIYSAYCGGRPYSSTQLRKNLHILL